MPRTIIVRSTRPPQSIDAAINETIAEMRSRQHPWRFRTVERPPTIAAAILDLLRDRGPSRRSEILFALSYAAPSVDITLQRLKRDHAVALTRGLWRLLPRRS